MVVARACDIPVRALRRRSRCSPGIAHARQMAMYLANIAGGIGFAEVGRGFGRDRSTVAHACARIEDLRDDPGIDRALTLLEAALRGAFRMPAPATLYAPRRDPRLHHYQH